MSRKAFYIAILMVFYACLATAQSCEIVNTGMKSYYFTEGSAAHIKYKGIKEDTSCINILLVISYGQTNQVNILSVAIDTVNQMIIEFIRNDSSARITKTAAPESLLKALFYSNTLTGFYEGVCPNINGHTIQTLVMSDPHSRKWIELTCFDNNLKDMLKTNKEFEYLKNVLEEVSKIKDKMN